MWGHLALQILAMFVSTAVWGGMRYEEAAVAVECVVRRTHGFSASPVGLLSQAVHAKNSCAVCVAWGAQMHT